MKLHRRKQDRHGNPARRLLEFKVIVDQVKRKKEAFIIRLQRHVKAYGQCFLYEGTLDHRGYPRINFRYKGKHVTIGAHRLFLILKTCAPIPRGREAGHTCKNRRCVRHVELQHYVENAATNL